MKKDHHQSLSTGKYVAGFILAIILTLISFIPVIMDMMVSWTISAKILYLMGFGLLQIIVQVVYFLHLNEGVDAKWNIGTLFFALGCVMIIIGGTWWAIQHLNYNMMGGSGRIIIPQPIENEHFPAE